jgi:hypothetical protein
MSNAIERVNAACMESPYKDNRHSWSIEAGQDFMVCYRQIHYEVRRCMHCKLVVFLTAYPTERVDWGDHSPTKSDIVHFAAFESDLRGQ